MRHTTSSPRRRCRRPCCSLDSCTCAHRRGGQASVQSVGGLGGHDRRDHDGVRIPGVVRSTSNVGGGGRKAEVEGPAGHAMSLPVPRVAVGCLDIPHASSRDGRVSQTHAAGSRSFSVRCAGRTGQTWRATEVLPNARWPARPPPYCATECVNHVSGPEGPGTSPEGLSRVSKSGEGQLQPRLASAVVAVPRSRTARRRVEVVGGGRSYPAHWVYRSRRRTPPLAASAMSCRRHSRSAGTGRAPAPMGAASPPCPSSRTIPLAFCHRAPSSFVAAVSLT